MRAALLALVACGTNATPQPAPPPVLPNCVPDRDGAITASELPIVLGATAAYYTSANVAVALGGDPVDLSEERASDEVVGIGPVALADQWYATMFPGAAFAVDAGGGLDGVFHQDAEGLWLHGTASREPSPKTLVRYPLPVAVLRFPIVDGDTFIATGDIPDGVISGLPFVGGDRVEVDVAAADRLDLPYVRFSPVLRVRTHVVRTPSTGTPVVGKRSTSMLFECFGEVVHAEAATDEPNPDFTTAATLRRFALGVTP